VDAVPAVGATVPFRADHEARVAGGPEAAAADLLPQAAGRQEHPRPLRPDRAGLGGDQEVDAEPVLCRHQCSPPMGCQRRAPANSISQALPATGSASGSVSGISPNHSGPTSKARSNPG
jgi:hypothetical protein